MKILVCAKVIKGEINPFDQSAIECALRLSDDVEVITMGPESNKAVLLPLTRLGAKVTLITDRLFAGSDTLATSYILSEAIKKKEYDLILCGRQSIDGDTAQIGPMLAKRLEIPFITNVVSLEIDGEMVTAKSRAGIEKAKIPALITMERSFILRFPGIFSKLGEINCLDNAELICDPDRCGLKGSPTKVIKTFENEKGKRNCKFISANEFFSLVEELKEKTGLDKEVRDYVMASEDSKRFLDRLLAFIDCAVPMYAKEGKSQLVISIGCTGGKHRSVTFAELIGEHLRNENYNCSINHRDIYKH